MGNNRLNAVSQYYCFCLFPEIVAKQKELAAALQRFFDEHLKTPFASHGSYVVDFWIDFADLSVLVVELNPFHIGAGLCCCLFFPCSLIFGAKGAALFSWREDRALFLHGPAGGAGFELRVATRLEERPFDILPARWAEYIRGRRQQPAACALQ